MSDQAEHPIEEAPDQTAQGDETEMRPLPDGGLGENMPDWLRRPPAWRDLPISDTRSSGSTPGDNPPPRDLPPEDTSIIDPTTLIEFEDLPDWLRELSAQRLSPDRGAAELRPEPASRLRAGDESDETMRSAVVPAVEPATVSPEVEPGEEARSAASEEAPIAATGPIVVETSEGPPPVPGPHPLPGATPPRVVETREAPIVEPTLSFWQQGRVVQLLAIALLVAVVLAILFATGAL